MERQNGHPVLRALEQIGLSIEQLAEQCGCDTAAVKAALLGDQNPFKQPYSRVIKVLHKHGLLSAGTSAIGAMGWADPNVTFNALRPSRPLIGIKQEKVHALIVGTLTHADVDLLNQLQAAGHLSFVVADCFAVIGGDR